MRRKVRAYLNFAIVSQYVSLQTWRSSIVLTTTRDSRILKWELVLTRITYRIPHVLTELRPWAREQLYHFLAIHQSQGDMCQYRCLEKEFWPCVRWWCTQELVSSWCDEHGRTSRFVNIFCHEYRVSSCLEIFRSSSDWSFIDWPLILSEIFNCWYRVETGKRVSFPACQKTFLCGGSIQRWSIVSFTERSKTCSTFKDWPSED